MTQKFMLDNRVLNGMSYQQYIKMTNNQFSSLNPESLNLEELEQYSRIKLNIFRMNRIDRTYSPGTEIINKAGKIEDPQLWMVITENWCGDSAQNLPYIAAIASLSKKIQLRIILRDSNTDIMDNYLTNGTRSIPKLVSFDEEGNELFHWGARPKVAQDLVTDLKSQGLEKKYFLEKLHSWYARNSGVDIENEFLALLKKSNFIKNSV